MHIPDGFLNIATVATTYAASAGGSWPDRAEIFSRRTRG